mgnify:CR=1 FL=1
MRLAKPEILLVVALWALAAFSILAHGEGTDADAWEFRAALREAIAHPGHLTHPLLKDSAAHTNRYTPMVLGAARVCRMTGMSPRGWLDLQGLAAAALLIGGLLAFSHARWPGQPGRYALLAAFFLWGSGWDWSGELAWNTLCKTWSYPVTLAFAGALWTAVAAFRWLETGGRGRWALLTALLAAVITTHPETGAFATFLAMLGVLAPWRPGRIPGLLLAAGLAWGLAFAWPTYSLLVMILGGSGGGWLERDVTFFHWQLGNAGPALLGIPAAFRFARDRKEPFLVLGIAALSVGYAAVSFKGGELGRMVFWLVFLLQMAAARLLAEWRVLDGPLLWERLRQGRVFHVGVAMLGLWAFAGARQVSRAGGEALRAWTGRTPRIEARYAPLRPFLAEGDVVAADLRTGWPLPSLTGARLVAPLHAHPMQPDGRERARDLAAFLDPRTPSEARRDLAGRYGITHVLLDRDPSPDRFGAVVGRAGGLVLVRLAGP